jgi:hypothetical protein
MQSAITQVPVDENNRLIYEQNPHHTYVLTPGEKSTCTVDLIDLWRVSYQGRHLVMLTRVWHI